MNHAERAYCLFRAFPWLSEWVCTPKTRRWLYAACGWTSSIGREVHHSLEKGASRLYLARKREMFRVGYHNVYYTNTLRYYTKWTD